jgi:hypothetical protein
MDNEAMFNAKEVEVGDLKRLVRLEQQKALQR